MKILINLENTDDFREFDISADDSLETIKYISEAEFGLLYNEQEIVHNGVILKDDKKTLKDINVNENDIIVLRKKLNFGNFNFGGNSGISGNTSGIAKTRSNDLGSIFDNTMKILKNNRNNPIPNPNANSTSNSMYPNLLDGMFSNASQDLRIKSEINNIKDIYLSNPDQLNYLFNIDNTLAEALVSGDDKKLEEIVKGRIKDYDAKKQKEYLEYMKLANSDSNDLEAQKKIEEIIRMKNIEENMQMAHEYLPESFGQVHMLYINLEINKQNIVGLVDTGAQTTIISEDLARKCGLFNLCDTRYAGIAKGVGVSKIIGVIHAAQIKVGDR